MTPHDSTTRVARFGVFGLDLRTGELCKRGSAESPRFVETLEPRWGDRSSAIV